MKILYSFPTKSRPDKAIACIQNIHDMSESENYEIILKVDFDDASCNNTDFISKIAQFKKVVLVFGESRNKVHAINRDIPKEGWDILMNQSDDMWFIKKGFDADVINAFIDFDGLVHFPDPVAKERLCTYSMMSNNYYNQFGYIYHPDYVSVYCDHHQQEVAKKLGKYKYVNSEILEHRHAIWGFGEPDELLKKTEDPLIYARDKRTLDYQRSINFGL